ncbi:MAG: hypothetical protein GXP45_07030 [bacterium]|nr:hypothetical protein [bacterium]
MYNAKSAEDLFLTNELLFNLFKKRAVKKQKIVLTLILFNLFWDGQLRQSFGLEDLIDVLFSSSLEDGQPLLLEKYLELVRKNLKLTIPIKLEFDILSSFVK